MFHLINGIGLKIYLLRIEQLLTFNVTNVSRYYDHFIWL
jgi:hypothetical protein